MTEKKSKESNVYSPRKKVYDPDFAKDIDPFLPLQIVVIYDDSISIFYAETALLGSYSMPGAHRVF